MWAFIIIIVIAIVAYSLLFSDKNKKSKSSEPPTPPTFDAVIIGCNCDCGYATPEFKKNANGDYDGTNMIYCAYQKKSVRRGSKCPYAEDYPDKLGKSVFED
jgi:hypothetical protein